MKVTREQIVHEALKHFAREDYDRVSLNAVARSLHITKGGIYHYFDSKDSLFKETVLYMIHLLEHLMMDNMDSDQSLHDQIRPFFQMKSMSARYAQRIGLDFFEDYKALVYIIFSAMKKFDDLQERLGKIYRGVRSNFTRLIIRAQERGELRADIDAEALAFEITAFAEGGLLVSVLENTPDPDELSMRAFENFWNRISAE